MEITNNTNQTSGTERTARTASRSRIGRGAAALVVAASAAFGSTAISMADAGAFTPLPDPIPPGGWVLPPNLPTIPPAPLPPVRRPLPPVSIPIRPPIPPAPLPGGPIPFPSLPLPLPPAPPAESDVPRVTIPPAITPDDFRPERPILDCTVIDCTIDPGTTPDDVPTPDDELTPDETTTTTTTVPGLGYPDGEGLTDGPTAPEPASAEATPVKVESAEGVLAFTGSDAFLPLAGAGLLGAGGVLAGISVLARRARNGRS